MQKNIILDGFYYRLEWAEIPSQFMLFRSFVMNKELIDNMKVEELEFINEYEMYNNQTVEELRKLDWCNNDSIKF